MGYFSKEKFIDILIEKTSIADVAEVVHGTWNEDGRCSNCDWYMPFDSEGNAFGTNYCPHCGAEMDGKDNNVSTNEKAVQARLREHYQLGENEGNLCKFKLKELGDTCAAG